MNLSEEIGRLAIKNGIGQLRNRLLKEVLKKGSLGFGDIDKIANKLLKNNLIEGEKDD